MSDQTQAGMLKQLRQDLLRKYELHGERVGEIWRAWSPAQRAKALKAGAAEGVMLKSRTDRSLGFTRLLIPEWNIQDLTAPSPDPSTLMAHLRHRALSPLLEQYAQGPNGQPGDADVIFHGMERGLQYSESYRYEFTQFIDEESYGVSMAARDGNMYRQVMAGMQAAVDSRHIVPRSAGELILARQVSILQALNILVEDILELGSSTRATAVPKKKQPKEINRAPPAAADSKPAKLSLDEILARAQDQKSSVEDYLGLCRKECAFLAPIVNMWFATRPELLPDERGQRLPLHTDKYKSTAFFEALHSAVIGVAVWDYICRLLQTLIDKPDDRQYRTMVLQEISNVCHFEYDRVQKLFKRYVQTCTGAKYFRRASGGGKNKAVRVVMKGKPEAVVQEDPQLGYLLHLCEPKTSAIKSVQWIAKLDELHHAEPRKLEELFDSEYDALGDLAVIAAFIQSLAASLPLPPPNGTKGQVFVSRLKSLTTELDALTDDLDLSDFVVPIDNLLEPGVAERALVVLNNFIINKAGSEIGLLYEGVTEEALNAVQVQYSENRAIEKDLQTRLSITEVSTPTPEVIIQERREKAKTRPAHSSVYSIVGDEPAAGDAEAPSRKLKVNRDAFEVFSTLFSRAEAQGQGSITWAAFQKAMQNLKFSVIPRFGSVFSFLPPGDPSLSRPFTIHRPHQSRIEGYKLIYFANRLKRIYGWGTDTFEVA
ncbi:uncharacterized protein DSM5745_06163 [Aspergillus mulundensis]|uniref:Ipa protein n=1 Tax=Aspergillus mulundensis TaxID=1810919 RepID=A0A3D8RZR3_9EURO|nr:Uncharacterized protein DSM5745_06163 [Aspergillus mulundensis]RDW79311.1 Uncharacterized protein DSM5745_06163 [Aspergillus mulundensis]